MVLSRPKIWAPGRLKGYKDGAFGMPMGSPEGPSRYLSSYGIKEMRDAENTPRAQVRGVKQEVMTRHMRADEAVDRKSTRLNSSHANISYAVFCLKKKIEIGRAQV